MTEEPDQKQETPGDILEELGKEATNPETTSIDTTEYIERLSEAFNRTAAVTRYALCISFNLGALGTYIVINQRFLGVISTNSWIARGTNEHENNVHHFKTYSASSTVGRVNQVSETFAEIIVHEYDALFEKKQAANKAIKQLVPIEHKVTVE